MLSGSYSSKTQKHTHTKRKHFKFINGVASTDKFLEEVSNSLNYPFKGGAMYTKWIKLQRLQHVIRKRIRPLVDIKDKLNQVRGELNTAQQNLINDKINYQKIDKVR